MTDPAATAGVDAAVAAVVAAAGFPVVAAVSVEAGPREDGNDIIK